MNISKEDYEKFQKQYMLEVIRDPTYRYGQAFMNYFINSQSFINLSSYDDAARLWDTESKEKAELLIKHYFKIV